MSSIESDESKIKVEVHVEGRSFDGAEWKMKLVLADLSTCHISVTARQNPLQTPSRLHHVK